MTEQHILNATLQGQSQVAYLEQISDQEFWAYATRLAEVSPLPTTALETYLECELQGQGRVIVPLGALREVVPPPQPITFLPVHPLWMAGLTAWRGEPLPVVDLDAYLTQRDVRYYRSDQMMLVVEHKEVLLGLLVSVIGSLTTLEAERLQSVATIGQQFFRGVPLSSHILVGVYGEVPVLNIPEILVDIMRAMRAVAVYE